MFDAKRGREFRVDLPTVLTLEAREENLFNTFDIISSIRDGIEGDSCWPSSW